MEAFPLGVAVWAQRTRRLNRRGGAAAPEGSSSKVPAQGQPARLIKPFSCPLLQQEDGL